MTTPTPSVEALHRAKRLLGVRNLLLGIHDAAFPSAPDEDVGRGTPHGAGAAALLEFAAALGFDGVQLGPQGHTGPGNPSPYDGTLFSRNPLSISLPELTTAAWGGLLSARTLERIVTGRPGPTDRAAYAYAHREVGRALDEVWRAFRSRPAEAGLGERFARFRAGAGSLARDALYAALAEAHGRRSWRVWQDSTGAAHPDQDLFSREDEPARARAAGLRAVHGPAVDAYLFVQFVAHEQHRAFRDRARLLGLSVWGDAQCGLSEADAWAHSGLLLGDYHMGAPPSRTHAGGQPWGYPVLDPRLCEAGGPGLLFLSERFERCFEDYDGVRLDHPHALVCPWVYQAREPDQDRAVREGARLHESPDLPDHPRLAAFARVRPEQVRRELPRHADGWVTELTPDQVERYSTQLDLLLAAARRHGRGPERVACEVLSTCPEPLRRVLERHGLGRFRVTQKADPDDARDVYRGENARPEDWIMVGNHDTPTVWGVAERWVREGSAERHAAYLASRLLAAGSERGEWIERAAADPRRLAQAKLAELFVGPAANVMVFFADLFGLLEPYNRPGTTHEDNWSTRLRPDFRELYAERRARGEALDIGRGLAAAIRSRGAAFAAAHGDLLHELGG